MWSRQPPHRHHNPFAIRTLRRCLGFVLFFVIVAWGTRATAQSPQQTFLRHWQAAHGSLAKKACFPAIREFHKAFRALASWKSVAAAKRTQIKSQIAMKLASCYLRVGPGMLARLHPVQRRYWRNRYLKVIPLLPNTQSRLQQRVAALARSYRPPPPKGKTRQRPQARRQAPTKKPNHLVRAEGHLQHGKLLKAITALRMALRANKSGSTPYTQAQQVLRFLRHLQQIDAQLRDQQYKPARQSVRKRRAEVAGLVLSVGMQKKLMALLQRRMFQSYDSEALLASRGLECTKAARHWQRAHRVATPVLLPSTTRKALLRCHLGAGDTELRARKWRRAITQFRSAEKFEADCSPAQKLTTERGLAMALGVRAQATKDTAHKRRAIKELKAYLGSAPPKSPGYNDAERLAQQLATTSTPVTPARRRRFVVELGVGGIFLPAAGLQVQAAFDFYPLALLGFRVEAGLDSTNPLLGHVSGGAILVLGQTWQFTFKALAGARFRNSGAGFQILTGPGLRYRWPMGLQLGVAATASIDLYQGQPALLIAAHTNIGFAF